MATSARLGFAGVVEAAWQDRASCSRAARARLTLSIAVSGVAEDVAPEGGAAAASGRIRRLRHIPELDGLRGIAALMVFFHHACSSTVPASGWTGVTETVWRASAYGNAGVDLFFILSGFLITSILLGDRNKPRYYEPFYWKRVLRIVPVYVLVLLYVALFLPHNDVALWCAALFVANFSMVFHVAPVMPFWSLAIEEQFYLVWPTVVRRTGAGALGWWALVIAAGSVALRFVFAAHGHYNYFLTFLHCDGLALGALLATMYVRREEQRGGPAWPTVLGAAVLGAALVAVSGHLPEGTLVRTARAAATGLTGVTLLSFAIVGWLVFASGSRWLGVFRSRVLGFFGLISYCFYLVHLYVLQAYDGRWGAPVAGDARAFWTRFLAVLAVSVLISTVSRYAVELPAQRLRRYIPVLRTPV